MRTCLVFILSVLLYSPAFADCQPVFWVHHVKPTAHGYSVYAKQSPVLGPGQKAMGEEFITWLDEDSSNPGPAEPWKYAFGQGTLCEANGEWHLSGVK